MVKVPGVPRYTRRFAVGAPDGHQREGRCLYDGRWRFELVPINSTGRVGRVYVQIHFMPGFAIVELPEIVRVIDAWSLETNWDYRCPELAPLTVGNRKGMRLRPWEWFHAEAAVGERGWYHQ